jgi:hypothetical protein
MFRIFSEFLVIFRIFRHFSEYLAQKLVYSESLDFVVTVTTCIKTDEQEYYIPEEQKHRFLKYFEDLSVPKDKGYDSEYLELCNIRHDLISKLYAEDTKSLEPFQEEDIYKAIAQLNTGKAANEYGIVSEQLKVSDQILVPLITCLWHSV